MGPIKDIVEEIPEKKSRKIENLKISSKKKVNIRENLKRNAFDCKESAGGF